MRVGGSFGYDIGLIGNTNMQRVHHVIIWRNYSILWTKEMSWLYEKTLENIFAMAFSSIAAILVTAFVFYLTSPPVVSDDVKLALVNVLARELRGRPDVPLVSSVVINGVFATEFGLDQAKTIFVSATALSAERNGPIRSLNTGRPETPPNSEIEDDEVYGHRLWAIFEPTKQGLFDKISGRPGFYNLKTFAYASIYTENELVPDKIESIDIDSLGDKGIMVDLHSDFADRSGRGFILFHRNQKGSWQISSLPEMSSLIRRLVQGNANPLGPSMPPFCCFGGRNRRSSPPRNLQAIADQGVYEDTWTAVVGGVSQTYSLLANGGKYVVSRHSQRGYLQILTLAFTNDENAVLAPHRAFATMLRFRDGRLEVDDLWNWGKPIMSIEPMRIGSIDIDSVMKAGIEAHISGDTFFGYTEFSKRR
jgi:hypothetical protein